MSPRITLATAARVLRQLRHDPRTIALLLVVPVVLETLLRLVYDGKPAIFDRIGAPLLDIFPLITMFLVTSIATLRERTSGTLERLLTMPLAKLDLLLGYALAFGAFAVLQVAIATGVALTVLGLDVAGPGLAHPRARGRQRGAGHRVGAVRQRLCRQRVPGRPVHASGHPAPAAAVRVAAAARADADGAAVGLRRAAAVVRRGRHVPG